MFLPDGKRATDIDHNIRRSLSHSLITLLGDDSVPRGTDLDALAAIAPPALFGLYYDLLVAQQQRDDAEARAALLAAIEHYAAATGTGDGNFSDLPVVINLSEAARDDAERQALLRWLDLEPENALAMVPLTPQAFGEAKGSLQQALEVLRAFLPAFFAEFAALTRQLIFARPGGDEKLTFGGVSSFALWGALVLNSEAHPRWYDYLPRLVHEYSHNLLFGLAMHEPLVLNDPAERITSPLRGAERPVDGVYHAAFVSAREALAMQQLATALEAAPASAVPDKGSVQGYVSETARSSAAMYRDCLEALHRHARFTETGQRILADTEAAMGRPGVA